MEVPLIKPIPEVSSPSSPADFRPISIASVSGEIDITMPAKTAMDLEMETVSGNMYSDFDFPSGGKQMRRIGGSSINTQLNGGGVSLKLNTVSGNIYLRKG